MVLNVIIPPPNEVGGGGGGGGGGGYTGFFGFQTLNFSWALNINSTLKWLNTYVHV